MELVELFCTYDADEELWHVWFAHPLGGMNVLESFDNEADAKTFWEQEIANADYGCDNHD